MTSPLIHFAGATIDPLARSRAPAFASADRTSGQHVVQLNVPMAPAIKAKLEATGARVIGYFPDSAYLVRMPASHMAKIRALPFVRATLGMPSHYKVAARFRSSSQGVARASVIVSTIGHDVVGKVARELRAQGFTNLRFGHDVICAEASAAQVASAAANDDIVWIGPDSTAQDDVDLVRKIGGSDFLAQNTPSGFQGDGMRVHVFEGIEQEHPAYAETKYRKAPIALGDPAPDGHGNATAGIIGADGDPKVSKWARGIVPHAQLLYTNRTNSVSMPPGSRMPGSRWYITKMAVEKHNIDGQTASWGHEATTKYDERSRELDSIMCEYDLAVTQSQSNYGDARSRPQAWAKNVIPVTALYHFDNLDFGDDTWKHGSSTRNGDDPRIGRTLSGFYDKIGTTALHGKYQEDFGGTSGATPMVQGFIDQVMQMFKEGVFTKVLINPSSWMPAQHPRAATTAALAIASARQHPFAGRAAENNRYEQGWGLPDMERLYKARETLMVVNEDRVMKTGDSVRYSVNVKPGEPELKVSLVWKDPPALVSAGKDQVNDFDLKVTAPDGTMYLGNVGLLDGIYSKPGGERDRIDTVENVFIEKPAAGAWTIEVHAAAINEPLTGSVLESPFALVALGAVQARAKTRRRFAIG
jgi:serine protease AprX